MGYDKTYHQKSFAFAESQEKAPIGIWWRGHYQSILVAGSHGMIQGATVGAGLGIFSSIYYRKVRIIPGYALAFGGAYASWLMTSAFFRMDL